ITAGDRVAVKLSLRPPAKPLLPGAYDFARYAYFDRIGAVGFTLGDIRIIEKAADTGLASHIASLRQRIRERITSGLAGEEGAVAAALLVNDRGSISKDVLEAMRESGIAHLLAISGMHLA